MTSVQNETSLHIARDDGHGVHGMMGIFAKVCRVDVDVETLKGLSDIAKIVAIKEETGDIRRVTDMFNSFGDRFDIFCGVDDLLLESVALGAVGWVSGMTNAWPVECVKLFNLAKGGKFAEALRL